jgi:hypothetical protein
MSFNGTRTLRSAAGLFYLWDMQVAYSGRAIKENGRGHTNLYSSPTDEIAYTLQQEGMKARMGNRGRQSHALKFEHILFMDEQLEARYQGAPNPAAKHEAAAAGTANLVLWLGALRGGETFSLERADVEVVNPANAIYHGLPEGLGYVELRLLPETKSQRFRLADVLIAYTAASGLSLGKWMRRLLKFAPVDGVSLFSTPTCRKWNSSYFRNAFAWPLLEQLCATGAASLMFVADKDGQQIRDHFWSCHSWRRGINTFVKRPPPGIVVRRANDDEVYEHQRWKKRQSQAGEAMPILYNEWDKEMRLAITLLCA